MQQKNVSKALVKRHLPIRSKDTNKTHGGKLLVIGGSKGMYGAGILSALAGTRAGAGYTYLMMDWKQTLILKHPDILFLKSNLKILNTLKASAYVLGPGLGQSNRSKTAVSFFLKNKISNVVLDADGLNILAKKETANLPSSWILTPHQGELARLLNTSSLKIKENPIFYLIAAQKKFGCVILLKGATTYITNGETVLICKSGTPALAKAGTGDVLAGIIGGLLAQNVPSLMAAAIGAYVHGLTSQKFLREGNDVISLRPIDLIEYLPKILKLVRR